MTKRVVLGALLRAVVLVRGDQATAGRLTAASKLPRL